MSFVVMTDTSGNLPPQYLLDYSLEIIPFSYFIEGKEYNSAILPFICSSIVSSQLVSR